MIVKKNYGDSYIIMKVTNIQTNETGDDTLLYGKLVGQNGCEDFLGFDELCLHMTNNVEVIEA